MKKINLISVRIGIVIFLLAVSCLLGFFSLKEGMFWIGKSVPGFTVSQKGQVTTLMHPQWTGYRAGLLINDRILSYDGVPYQSQKELIDALNREDDGRNKVTYTVERDGQRIEIDIEPMFFTVDDWIASFMADTMVGVVFIMIAAVLFFLNPALYGNFLLCLASFGIGLMHLLATDYYLDQKFAGVLFLSFFFFAVASSQTNFDLFRRHSPFYLKPRAFNILTIVLLTAAGLAWQFWLKDTTGHSLFAMGSLVAYGVSFLVAHVNCTYIYFTTDSALTRKIIRMFNLIFLTVVFPYAYYILREVFDILIPRELVFLQIGYPLLLAATIVRFRSVDFNIHLRRPTLFGMIGFLVTSGLAILFTVIPVAFRNYDLSPRLGQAALFLGVALTVFFIFYSAHTRLFDRLFFHSSYRFPDIINAINEQVLTKLSVDRILGSLEKILARDFKISQFHIYLSPGSEDDFILWNRGSPEFKPADVSLPAKIERKTSDIGQKDFLMLSEITLLEHQLIRGILESNRLLLFLPIRFQQRVIGLVFLGHKNDQTPFSPEDLTNLKTFLGILATALSNANQHEMILKLQERLKVENTLLKVQARKRESAEVVGEKGDLKDLFKNVEKISGSNMTVLIQGESGVGKEVIARVVHDRSQRNDKTFVAINCAAIPETLLESELFGYERGAFTDAQTRRIGLFEEADGGTLFLDEIGDVSPAMQLKLLRVLQEKEIKRVGGAKMIPVDVRIIAATNKDLEKEVQAGKFRKDLYYRLNVFPIHIPPLRQRQRDLEDLIPYFIRKFSERMNKDARLPDQQTWNRLMAYSWPGNIRELQNLIERSVAVCPDGERLAVYDLEGSLFETLTQKIDSFHQVKNYHDQMSEYQKALIRNALLAANGNKTQAARNLGIHVTHLYKILKQLNITVA